MITIEEYFKKMNKLDSRPTKSVIKNAEALITRVSQLLDYLKEFKFLPENYDPKLSSGWRNAEYNKSIGGARNSHHIKGNALDIKGDRLTKVLMKNPDILEKFDLYMESIYDARYHCHLQIVPPRSTRRIFRA